MIDIPEKCPECGVDLMRKNAVNYVSGKALCAFCSAVLKEFNTSTISDHDPRYDPAPDGAFKPGEQIEFDLPSPRRGLQIVHFVGLVGLAFSVVIVKEDLYRFLLIFATIVWTVLIWQPWKLKGAPGWKLVRNIGYYYSISAVVAAAITIVAVLVFHLGRATTSFYMADDAKGQDTKSQKELIANRTHSATTAALEARRKRKQGKKASDPSVSLGAPPASLPPAEAPTAPKPNKPAVDPIPGHAPPSM